MVKPGCDSSLIASLLDRHGQALELYASQWTNAPEDCVQEAFVRLAKQRTPPQQPGAWLFRVVRNLALNLTRSTRRRAHHEGIAAWLTHRRAAEREEMGDHLSVVAAMQTLSANESELVVLRIWSGLTWNEIGRLVGTSSSSAQRSYVGALAKMRTHLELPCQSHSKSPNT